MKISSGSAKACFYASGGTAADEDVLGGFLQGTYDILPKKLQLVTRYSFTFGDGPASVRRQGRYESLVVDAAGNAYHSAYTPPCAESVFVRPFLN